MFTTLKNHFLFLAFVFTFAFNGFSQISKHTIQVGTSAMPIFDVLNLYPKNKIAGIAISGNVGFFVTKRLSFGLQPNYAVATNSFPYYSTVSSEEKQKIKLYGLSSFLRYIFLAKTNLALYSLASIGFGNLEINSRRPSISGVSSITNHKSILATSIGLGLNYFVTNNLAIELNIPYVYLKYFTNEPSNKFGTVAPSIGFQYYLN